MTGIARLEQGLLEETLPAGFAVDVDTLLSFLNLLCRLSPLWRMRRKNVTDEKEDLLICSNRASTVRSARRG